MIKAYNGPIYEGGDKSKVITEDGDGFQAVCDCCGETFDPQEYAMCFDDADDAIGAVEDHDWVVIGRNCVICADCMNDIRNGLVDVTATFNRKQEFPF